MKESMILGITVLVICAIAFSGGHTHASAPGRLVSESPTQQVWRVTEANIKEWHDTHPDVRIVAITPSDKAYIGYMIVVEKPQSYNS